MPKPTARDRALDRVIAILRRGRDDANTEAGGIAVTVTYTRFEVNEMITLLLDAREVKATKRTT